MARQIRRSYPASDDFSLYGRYIWGDTFTRATIVRLDNTWRACLPGDPVFIGHPADTFEDALAIVDRQTG